MEKLGKNMVRGVAVFTSNKALPFPGDTMKIILSSATYARLLMAQKMDSTSPFIISSLLDDDTPAIPNVTLTFKSLEGKDHQLYRYAIVGNIDEGRKEEIIRQADKVLLPVEGIAFVRIDKIIEAAAFTATVEGKIFFLEPHTPIDKALLQELETKVREKHKHFLEMLSYFEQAFPDTNQIHGTYHTIKNKLHEALALLESKDNVDYCIRAVGRIVSVSFMVANVVTCDILNLIREASSEGENGIDINDYTRIALKSFHLAYAAVENLYEATNMALEEERNWANLTSLQRLQQALELRYQQISKAPHPRNEILAKLEEVNPPPEVRSYIEREVMKLGSGFLGHWAETEVTLKHINFLLSLPWNKRAESKVELSKAKEILDTRLYGLRKAKEKVLEYLATIHHLGVPALRGVTLCFVGAPGTGKTDLATQIAKALNRPFARIALGGVNDEANIKGHRRTYVGSMPGDIMKALAKCGVKNPVIVLDEVDKMRIGVKGDPVAALMDALDPEFNSSFTDFFVDFPFDLSEVLFICSANNAENIPAPLRDRMEIVEFRPYTYAEKKIIARDYLVPRLREELKCPPDFIKIDDGVYDILLSQYTMESGVRELYRLLKRLFMKALTPDGKKIITPEDIPQLLWDVTPQVWKTERKDKLEVGMSPTLGILGDTGEGCVTYLMVEPIYLLADESSPEEDEIVWTTLADEAAQSSVLAGLRAARRIAKKLWRKSWGKAKWVVHSTRPFLKTSGTSWGLCATLAALSAVKGKPLPSDCVYTGEVDIWGNIYAVGGVETKIATAELVGFKTIFLPQENKHSVHALDFSPQIEIHLVSKVEDVLAKLRWMKG